MGDFMVSVLNFASLAIAGLLGLVGILGETRDGNKRLTTWGKAALGGIIASIFVGMLTQITLAIKDKQDAEVKAREAQRAVEQVRTPLMPTKPMTVSFGIDLKLNHPQLIVYRNRIDALLAPALGSEKPPPEPPDTHWDVPMIINGPPDKKVRSVSFGRHSPFFPTENDGALLPAVFDHLGIVGNVQAKKSGARLYFTAVPMNGESYYRYGDSGNSVSFWVGDCVLGSFYSDRIVSVEDFSEATITIGFADWYWGKDPEVLLGFEFHKLATITAFGFSAANRQYLVNNPNPSPGGPLVYQFPPNILEWDANLPVDPARRRAGPHR